MNRLLSALLLSCVFLAFQSPAFTGQKKEGAKSPKLQQTAKSTSKAKAPKKDTPPPPRAGKSADPAVGKTASGKIVYEGARGGFYYLAESGNRTYVQNFVGAKIVGKTPDGKNIFEGPRGGKFYYNDRGEKIYVKK